MIKLSRKNVIIAGAVLAILAIGGGLYEWWGARGSAPEYRLTKVERGSIVSTVSATGTVNPVVSVQVGSQVSGQIKEIYVDFNSPVKKGQVIARIDPGEDKGRMREYPEICVIRVYLRPILLSSQPRENATGQVFSAACVRRCTSSCGSFFPTPDGASRGCHSRGKSAYA